jgi:hypothetical protein
VKFNRIVFIIFILGGYLAYNALDITAYGGGIGIYCGVLKITVLSQVFDIILFITGAIITILTCFAPYSFKIYNNNIINSASGIWSRDNSIIDINYVEEFVKSILFFKPDFKNFYYNKLLKLYPYNDSNKEVMFFTLIVNCIKYFTSLLPDYKFNFPFLVHNELDLVMTQRE